MLCPKIGFYRFEVEFCIYTVCMSRGILITHLHSDGRKWTADCIDPIALAICDLSTCLKLGYGSFNTRGQTELPFCSLILISCKVVNAKNNNSFYNMNIPLVKRALYILTVNASQKK